ncbi:MULTISPECIES: ureidoglycolate lyase [unclassified Paracoccus (in: a-proteobacteria)]|uniref:ureidoglycolate lyase n=1 Tax=unclassified Paracoccus (in: a-proteobacteria) TaxID=2688777 RepID=UPI0012B39611|nr:MULTISPECIES: ureidoglycolate lyase [unclassified Paracoccus (in: a-proteobacteria)]UXU75098.1 ureidoglycolate lyase [Paracoccus sp. SMMA_5]UXU81001.1 ureidoglycolate lyase [Paracoccus sp. SMMA_5_TC]
MTTIQIRPLTAEEFAPFGEVLTPRSAPSKMINAGRCERHHALATVERGGGEAIISIFRSEPVSLPYDCTLLERHPLGSQAFMPLGPDPWLSIVAPDDNGRPGQPIAFLVPAGTGVNLRANVWHGVLTPLDRAADFLVVDREGEGVNLEEATIEPVTVVA